MFSLRFFLYTLYSVCDNNHYHVFIRAKSAIRTIDSIAIGVAPMTLLRTCVIKIVNIQGRSPNMVQRFNIPLGTALKGKNSLPLGANSFL